MFVLTVILLMAILDYCTDCHQQIPLGSSVHSQKSKMDEQLQNTQLTRSQWNLFD